MKKLFGLLLLPLFYVPNASALDFGVGLKAGLNGAGIDLSVGLTKTINLRLAGAAIDIEGEDETITVGDTGAEGDVDAELDFDYGSTAVFVDWHVFNGGFRLTAGMFKNNGAAKLTGILQDNIVVDGQALDISDLANGEVSGEVSLGESFQPYVGIGWGRGAGGGGGLSFSADIGVALLDPSVDLDADVVAGGNFVDQAELETTLRDLEDDAEAELEDFELWPVIAFGINYAF